VVSPARQEGNNALFATALFFDVFLAPRPVFGSVQAGLFSIFRNERNKKDNPRANPSHRAESHQELLLHRSGIRQAVRLAIGPFEESGRDVLREFLHKKLWMNFQVMAIAILGEFREEFRDWKSPSITEGIEVIEVTI
jgi:hypothetical protein